MWTQVASTSELSQGKTRLVHVGNQRVLLCRSDLGLSAIEDVCTHDDGPLGDAPLSGHEITCPRHGAKFDVMTGKVLCMPAIFPIKTFPVKEEAGFIYIDLN